MTNLAFSKTDSDESEPAAVVVRRKTDGSYSFTLVEGGDDEIIRLLAAVEVMVDRAGGITEALTEQSVIVDELLDEDMPDLEQLIADKLGRVKREISKEERVAKRQLERQFARRRQRKLERIEDKEREEAGLPPLDRTESEEPTEPEE